jgi:hypothetical protein
MAQCIYRLMPNVYQWIERLASNTLVPVVFCLFKVDKRRFRESDARK